MVLYELLIALHYLFTELCVGDEAETEYEFDGSDREEDEAADGEGAPRFVHLRTWIKSEMRTSIVLKRLLLIHAFNCLTVDLSHVFSLKG